MAQSKPVVKVGKIQQRILLIRGEKVIVDADLAEFYGVPTKALNQAVRRNMDRFPADFMFQLNKNEKTEVVTNCDHLSKPLLQKSEGFRAPGDGISTSLQQGVKVEIVVGYIDPLTTQDLKSSGFPVG